MKRNRILLSSAKPTEKKRVLTAANGDYLSLSKPINVTEHVSIDFTVNTTVAIDKYIVYGNPSPRLRINGFGVILPEQFFNASLLIDGVSFPIATTNVNDHLGKVLTVTAQSNVSSSITAIGGTGSSSFLDCSIINFTINGEQFSLNEGNGSSFKGSNGTIGTTETSASNPENYINQNVIKPI
jgi:hypothetical protein